MGDVKIGVIGGTGLYNMPELTIVETKQIPTPFGDPSDDYIVGLLNGAKVAFLPRHGKSHSILPSEVNFRANIFGFKKLGVQWIISVSAVGSLREEIKPLEIVVPDQFFDATKGRINTFFGNGIVAHVSFSEPVCSILRNIIYDKAREIGLNAHNGGTYVCVEGPQFSTKAESNIYRRWNLDIIGMTNVQEAKLSREAEICYATVALVTDYDCWHWKEAEVCVETVIRNLKQNSENAKRLIKQVIPAMPEARKCSCASALKDAIVTRLDSISEDTKKKLDTIIGRYIS